MPASDTDIVEEWKVSQADLQEVRAVVTNKKFPSARDLKQLAKKFDENIPTTVGQLINLVELFSNCGMDLESMVESLLDFVGSFKERLHIKALEDHRVWSIFHTDLRQTVQSYLNDGRSSNDLIVLINILHPYRVLPTEQLIKYIPVLLVTNDLSLKQKLNIRDLLDVLREKYNELNNTFSLDSREKYKSKKNNCLQLCTDLALIRRQLETSLENSLSPSLYQLLLTPNASDAASSVVSHSSGSSAHDSQCGLPPRLEPAVSIVAQEEPQPLPQSPGSVLTTHYGDSEAVSLPEYGLSLLSTGPVPDPMIDPEHRTTMRAVIGTPNSTPPWGAGMFVGSVADFLCSPVGVAKDETSCGSRHGVIGSGRRLF